MTETMSFVDVSPSTLIMLKLSCTSAERAFCSIPALMAQSPVMKTSMVAMFGWIMPLPLATPPRWHSLPPSVKLTAHCFIFVSVVMMASATAALLPAAREETRGPMPASKGAMVISTPMTPVEATITSCGAMPSCAASSSQVVSAM